MTCLPLDTAVEPDGGKCAAPAVLCCAWDPTACGAGWEEPLLLSQLRSISKSSSSVKSTTGLPLALPLADIEYDTRKALPACLRRGRRARKEEKSVASLAKHSNRPARFCAEVNLLFNNSKEVGRSRTNFESAP